MLKADLHTHTSEDTEDVCIRYSAKDLINHASKLGFEVLAITNHNGFTYNGKLASYAMEKGILLIPGIEKLIENKEIVILNATKEAESIETFEQLKEYKKKNPKIFVMAPHPFYPKIRCVHSQFLKHNGLFDGIEYCHYYCKGFNPFNKKAVKKARESRKPLIGTSDAHNLFQLNKTYSLVDADKNIDSVLNALREHKVKIKTKPLSYVICVRAMISMIWNGTNKLFSKPMKSFGIL